MAERKFLLRPLHLMRIMPPEEAFGPFAPLAVFAPAQGSEGLFLSNCYLRKGKDMQSNALVNEQAVKLGDMLTNLRENGALVHNITNYVTVNDCANVLLACGGAPIMADDPQEAEEITQICGALNINIGTLNASTIPAMFSAGKRAAELGHPVLLDPVGAGASALRTKTALDLVSAIPFTVIRGNISEIKTLAQGAGTTQGVDADIRDAVTEENLPEAIAFAKAYAKQTQAVIAITGAIDIVTDGSQAYVIRNGHPAMSRITGTGCMLSAMTAAYLAANPKNPLSAAAAAVTAMGLAGERAHARLSDRDGNATLRTFLIDEIDHLTGDRLAEGANIELY